MSDAAVATERPTIALSEIKFSPRQRKDTDSEEFKEHVQALAASIEEFGLLHPITLDGDGELVAGFCRIHAFMELGIPNIPFQFLEELTPADKKRIELEENIRRRNLQWWEESAAIAEIDEMKRAEDPSWNSKKTAALVGKSTATVSQAKQLHKEVKKGKIDLKSENTLTGALKKLDRSKKLETKKKQIAARKEYKKDEGITAQVLHGDALELIRGMDDESFDVVISNFPFGIDLEFRTGERPYEDDEDEITHLIRNIIPEIYRVLRPESWAVLFFDTRKICFNNYQVELHSRVRPLLRNFEAAGDKEWREETLDILESSMGLTWWLREAGFEYITDLPSVWVKPNKTQGRIGDLRRSFIANYESFVFAAKGGAVLQEAGLQNSFIYNVPLANERIHDVQMPVDFCQRLIEIVTMSGAQVLDPFAGSASVGIAAIDSQCQFVGFELDPDNAEQANARLMMHILQLLDLATEGE